MKKLEKEKYSHIKQPFTLVKDENSLILVLGSFPSVKSRENGFFYMNPQNRFWKVLSNLFNENFVLSSKEEKISLLNKYHIALYDVIEECDIIGSSDASIKNVKYLDIKQILSNSKIKCIYLNGSKAYDLFINEFPEYKDISLKMPSTSPANAKCKLEDLVFNWKIILESLF